MKLDKSAARAIIIILFSAIAFYFVLAHFSGLWRTFLWLWKIFSPVVTGLCVAFLLNPLMSFFERKLIPLRKGERPRWWRRLCRGIAIIIALVVVLSAVTLLLLIILPEVTPTIKNFVVNIPNYITQVQSWLRELPLVLSLPEDFGDANFKIDWETTFANVARFLKDGTENALSGMVGVTFSVMASMWNIVFGLIIGVYILAQKEAVGRFFSRFVSAFFPRQADRVFKVSSLSYEAFSRFVVGQLTEALVIGSFCYLGMMVFTFPYALTIATIVAFTALIPVFGAWIGAILGALLILTVEPIQALWFLIFLFILQQVESNLIYPRVVGHTVGIPGLLVIISVWVGGSIAGVMGMLVAVPLCAVIYGLIKEAVNRRLEPLYIDNIQAEARKKEEETAEG